MPVRAKNRGGVRGRFFVLISEKCILGWESKAYKTECVFMLLSNLNYLKSQLSQISIVSDLNYLKSQLPRMESRKNMYKKLLYIYYILYIYNI